MNGKYVWYLTPAQWSRFLEYLSIYDTYLYSIALTSFTDDTGGSGYWILPLEGTNEDIWGEILNDFDDEDFTQGNDWGFDFWTASNLPGSLWP